MPRSILVVPHPFHLRYLSAATLILETRFVWLVTRGLLGIYMDALF